MSEHSKNYKKYKNSTRVIGIILTCTIVGAPVGIPMIVAASKNKAGYEYMKQYEEYINTTDKEEYYCDLFAAMYNLPPTFTEGVKTSDVTLNMMNDEQVKRLAEMEGWMSNFVRSNYPSDSERNYAAYIVARNVLKNPKGVPKEYIEYCQWIVDNYSKIDKAGLDENYRSQSFNPNEADDLNRHVRNVIDKNKITLTESAS